MKRCICVILGFLAIPALGSDPGVAAIGFLENLRDGQIDLDPGADTALQENTSELKRRTIRKQLERLKYDLKGGELELGEVRVDGAFAAVLVGRIGGFEASGIQVVPVAMVREGEEWLPAPVPASFENAVGIRSLQLGKKLSDLEDWMAKGRVTGLNQLLEESAGRTRRRIREEMIGEDLETDDLGALTARFLDACVSGNQAAILGFLGGLGDPLPQDWALRLEIAAAVAGSDHEEPGAMRFLASPEVVRVRIAAKKTRDSGTVSVGCLDPALAGTGGGHDRIGILHLGFSKDLEGRWRIEPPEGLLPGDQEGLEADEKLDADLLRRFPGALRRKFPLVAGETAAEAKNAIMNSLRNGDLGAIVSRMDLEGTADAARIAAGIAAETWWSVNDPASNRFPVEIGFREEGGLAAAVYQWFSPVDADRFQMRTFYFKKSDDGWVWNPNASRIRGTGEGVESQKALSEWIKESLPQWRLSWREILLNPSIELAKIEFGELVGDEEAKALALKWLTTLKERNIEAALSLSAWLGAEGEIPVKTLRNISYDLSLASRSKVALGKIHRSSAWVAVAISRVSREGTRDSFLPIIMTTQGPRVLPGIDLVAGGDRTRRFLNKTSFDRLERFAGKEKTSDLEELFMSFERSLLER